MQTQMNFGVVLKLNNVALYLHFSFCAAPMYLPVTDRPLGGNISPAAVL